MSIVAIIIVAAVIYTIYTTIKMIRLNKDPIQQELARRLIEASMGNRSESAAVFKFVVSQRWSSREVRTRMPHAVSMVKIMAPEPVYRRAIEIGREISVVH